MKTLLKLGMSLRECKKREWSGDLRQGWFGGVQTVKGRGPHFQPDGTPVRSGACERMARCNQVCSPVDDVRLD